MDTRFIIRYGGHIIYCLFPDRNLQYMCCLRHLEYYLNSGGIPARKIADKGSAPFLRLPDNIKNEIKEVIV